MLNRIRRGVLAGALAATVLAAPAGVARADASSPDIGAGVRRLLRFASCAFALAVAETPPQVSAAMLLCGRVLFDEV